MLSKVTTILENKELEDKLKVYFENHFSGSSKSKEFILNAIEQGDFDYKTTKCGDILNDVCYYCATDLYRKDNKKKLAIGFVFKNIDLASNNSVTAPFSHTFNVDVDKVYDCNSAYQNDNLLYIYKLVDEFEYDEILKSDDLSNPDRKSNSKLKEICREETGSSI